MRKARGHLVCVLIDPGMAGQRSALLPLVSHPLPMGAPSDSNAARLPYVSLGPSSLSRVLLASFVWGSAQHHFWEETFPDHPVPHQVPALTAGLTRLSLACLPVDC